MSEPTPKCFQCKQEIPVGKYYQLYQGQQAKVGDYCSPCWTQEQVRYEIEIKNGILKVIEAERERERDNFDDSKCAKCQKRDIDYKITGTDAKGNSIVELNLCSECNQIEISQWSHGKACCGQKGSSEKDSVKASSDGSFRWECNCCPFKKKSIPTKKATANCDKCKKVVELENPSYPKELHAFHNGRTSEHFLVCDDCYKCSQCKQKNIETIANEQSNKWKEGTWLCNDCHDNKPGNKKDKNQDENSEPVEGEDIYCENCDEWLDNPTDYTKKGGWNCKCNSCQSTVKVVKGEKEGEIGYYPLGVYMLTNAYCYVCGRKNCWSEEGIKQWEEDNKHKKPNWKKRKRERMAIKHDWKGFEPMILRHDCYLNCPLGWKGGCGKKFKLTPKTVPLFQWRHLTIFQDERCATCRLKELKELITEAQKKGQYLTEEGKEYLKELEEMVAEESGSSGTMPTSPSSPPSSSTPSTSTSKLGKKKKRLTTEITLLETVPKKTPIQETQLTNKKQELKEVEELEMIIKYFLENSIKRISIEGEKLVIEYSNGTKKTVAVDNQLKTIWDRMKKVNKNSLLASELGLDYKDKSLPNNPSNQINSQSNNKWWWIGGGIIVVLVIGGIIFLLTRKRKKKAKK